jgi:hypothetical protein
MLLSFVSVQYPIPIDPVWGKPVLKFLVVIAIFKTVTHLHKPVSRSGTSVGNVTVILPGSCFVTDPAATMLVSWFRSGVSSASSTWRASAGSKSMSLRESLTADPELRHKSSSLASHCVQQETFTYDNLFQLNRDVARLPTKEKVAVWRPVIVRCSHLPPRSAKQKPCLTSFCFGVETNLFVAASTSA